MLIHLFCFCLFFTSLHVLYVGDPVSFVNNYIQMKYRRLLGIVSMVNNGRLPTPVSTFLGPVFFYSFFWGNKK